MWKLSPRRSSKWLTTAIRGRSLPRGIIARPRIVVGAMRRGDLWSVAAGRPYRSGDRIVERNSPRSQLPRWATDVRSLAAAVIFVTLGVSAAHAESCSKSRDYLLGSLGGRSMRPPQSYQSLFKMCLATTSMSNVKDAYILKDGGIAVIPKQDSIAATAATLSTFCDAYPVGTLRFLTRKDLATAPTVSRIIQMSSSSSTPCKEDPGEPVLTTGRDYFPAAT